MNALYGLHLSVFSVELLDDMQPGFGGGL